MIVFSFSDYKAIGQAILESGENTAGEFEIKTFGNGELYCDVATNVDGKECAVVCSLVAGTELQSLLLSHTLKLLGAKKVTLIASYLGYMRQDKREPGRSMGSIWTGALMRSSGIDEVITVDLHSELAGKNLEIPIRSLVSTPVFAEAIGYFIDQDTMILAPDDGALEAARRISDALPNKLPVNHLNKVRTESGVTVTANGKVSSRVIMVDDILDSGGTLVAACKVLRGLGVKDVIICVTHGQFVGTKWQELFEIGVSKIFTTDSLPKIPSHDKIQIVSLSSIF